MLKDQTSLPQWAREAVAHLPVSITLDTAAKAVGVSKHTLKRAEDRGELRVLRTAGRGGRCLVLRDELAKLLAMWSTPVAARGA